MGRVEMGPAEDQITFSQVVKADDAIIIPANTWHNVTNIGNEPMKLYSIYSPANHPFDTEEATKQDATDQEG